MRSRLLLCPALLLAGLSSCDPGPAPGGEIPTIPAICTPPAQLADVSQPTTVVGSGTPASCTEAALDQAIERGGVIVFDCGSAPHTLALNAEKVVRQDTVIDGRARGGQITLDGGGRTRLFRLASTFDRDTPHLVVQRLRLVRGRTSDVANTTSLDAGGAAIHRQGGRLTVIDSLFDDHRAADSGQDVAGGAIFSLGVGDTVIVGSTFTNNRASNGGALGNLGNALVLVNSVVSGNQATGSGGNPGNGGNGGGVVIDGQGKTVTLCGVTLSGNRGNAFGGGLFRVAYAREPTTIDRSTVSDNTIPDQSPSQGGGLYLQNTTATLTASTVSNNAARFAGGLYLGPGTVVNFTNVSIAGNTAQSSLGGGMAIDDSVSGQIVNCTIAGNHAPGPVAFGGGIAGGGPGLVLRNSIVANNTAGNGFNPINCTRTLGSGGPNLQFPVVRAGGGSDDPGALCASGVTIASPGLGPLADNGGPTRTLLPPAGSPVLGQGTNCPATDQRGRPRPAACALGAAEP
jgi:hypothetical protein